jgi:hypothetical protein
MDADRITYQQLDELLRGLGFSRVRVEPKWLRYEHGPSDTIIVLVERNPYEGVRVTDAVSARLHLIEKGLITEGDLDAILSRKAGGQTAVSTTES